MLKIKYLSESFPASSSIKNTWEELETTWHKILWSAITVGRPNRHYVFKYGMASKYEAIFRVSLVRMALEQGAPGARRLRRTDVAKALDPTEKGAVNYFLGMTFSKLFSATLLDTPWLLHLDVFGSMISVVSRGRSRPDLVGETNSGDWIAIESKGRASQPDNKTKLKAKDQAKRCKHKSGKLPAYQIGAVTYYRGDILTFYWIDPPAKRESDQSISIEFADEHWRFYYAPVLQLFNDGNREKGQVSMVEIPELDIELGIVPEVYREISEGRWGVAKRWCVEHQADLNEREFESDGIRVVAGPTWSQRLANTGIEVFG